ncbi:hypothetical protein CDAR_252921 [Caerostris darwini]|uniref:Uncharacterized protein n=1 Tax=Caerostris darwini TaxID=1538125 RepID=A0AAV4Q612_9ARAC|nr:hypothetical protein CDAR_252921 [Caerostris darwini]
MFRLGEDSLEPSCFYSSDWAKILWSQVASTVLIGRRFFGAKLLLQSSASTHSGSWLPVLLFLSAHPMWGFLIGHCVYPLFPFVLFHVELPDWAKILWSQAEVKYSLTLTPVAGFL